MMSVLVRAPLIGFLILFAFSISLLNSGISSFPRYLSEGSYAQYEQRFSTGEVHELYWRLHVVNNSQATIVIRSHGVARNYTTGRLMIVPGGGLMTVDRDTWKILSLFLSNGTQQLSGPPVGEKMAFWISTSVNETTPIDNMYDAHALPISTDCLVRFDALSTARTCWLTDNVFGGGNAMARWYDKETGIVLKIETNITFMASSMSVLEMLNATNIVSLTALQPTDLSGAVAGGILIFVVAVTLTYFFAGRAKRNSKAEVHRKIGY